MKSNHLILALPVTDEFLVLVFTSILTYMPSCLRDCILVPIAKGNKDPLQCLPSSGSRATKWGNPGFLSTVFRYLGSVICFQ